MAVAHDQITIARKIRIFKDLGELSVKKIATSFAGRLGCDVRVTNLSSSMLRVSTLAEETSNPENAAVGISVKINGPVSGHAAFLLPYHEALSLVDAVLGQPVGTRKRLDELSGSALQEVARMVVSAQISALEEMTGYTLTGEPINMAVDMAYKMVSSIIAGAGGSDAEAMVTATRFQQQDWSLTALLLFIPQAGVINRLLTVAIPA